MRKLRKPAASKQDNKKGPNACAPKAPVKSAIAAGKLGSIITMLQRPRGATIADLCKATAWQAHSVRGALSGSLRKKMGLAVVSEKSDGLRRYRIGE